MPTASEAGFISTGYSTPTPGPAPRPSGGAPAWQPAPGPQFIPVDIVQAQRPVIYGIPTRPTQPITQNVPPIPQGRYPSALEREAILRRRQEMLDRLKAEKTQGSIAPIPIPKPPAPKPAPKPKPYVQDNYGLIVPPEMIVNRAPVIEPGSDDINRAPVIESGPDDINRAPVIEPGPDDYQARDKDQGQELSLWGLAAKIKDSITSRARAEIKDRKVDPVLKDVRESMTAGFDDLVSSAGSLADSILGPASEAVSSGAKMLDASGIISKAPGKNEAKKSYVDRVSPDLDRKIEGSAVAEMAYEEARNNPKMKLAESLYGEEVADLAAKKAAVATRVEYIKYLEENPSGSAADLREKKDQISNKVGPIVAAEIGKIAAVMNNPEIERQNLDRDIKRQESAIKRLQERTYSSPGDIALEREIYDAKRQLNRLRENASALSSAVQSGRTLEGLSGRGGLVGSFLLVGMIAFLLARK